MENQVKPFGIRRNLDYFKENFIIMWKSVTEYKVNFYSSLIIQLFFGLSHLLFFFILFENFGSVINWKLSDFLLFFLIYDTLFVLFGVFAWKWEDFKFTITSGKINNYLIRPIKPFYAHSLYNLSSAAFIMLIINLFTFPILFYFFDYHFSNVIVGIILFFLICYAFFIFDAFIKSVHFYSLGLGNSGVILFYNFNEMVRSYSYDFFKKFPYAFILLLFSGFFISSLLIPLTLGYEVWNLKLQFFILFSIIIIFTFLTLMLWHYGLKRYEAFG